MESEKRKKNFKERVIPILKKIYNFCNDMPYLQK